jgi:uncharacterized FAD-dependent dehydrogenase
MGPYQLKSFSLPIMQAFQRVEVGVRLEGHYQHPFFKALMQGCVFPDPKHLFQDEEQPLVSWRTFCFCQRGEIVDAKFGQHVALSGRADCTPTELTNIGFNTRIKLTAFNNLIPKLKTEFKISITEILDSPAILENYFAPDLAYYVAKGLRKLQQRFPELTANEQIYVRGPTIEGVGEYPVVESNLQVKNQNIYITGDTVGLFRGITAALLSGYFVGQQLSYVYCPNRTGTLFAPQVPCSP